MGSTAGRRLRLLGDEYLQFPAREPSDRNPTAVTPPAPMNLGMLDHITDSINEVAAHVRAAAPQAPPRPADLAGLYDWWIDSTPDLEGERRRERDRVIYRQGLEHAIQAGDTDVVCKHPCPACGCWGIQWSKTRRRAACCNLDCVDDDGVTRTWSLAHLAYEHVARQEKLNVRAT